MNAEQNNSNGQQIVGQTPAPVPSQAAGAAAAAEAGAQQAAAATAQQAVATAAQHAAVAAERAAGQPPAAQPLAKNPISVWGRLPESENYIKFIPENNFMQKIQFIDNEPKEKPSIFTKGKMDYEFEVVDMMTPELTVKTWSVSSIKLMRQLSAFLPLAGKIFDVQRVGEGMAIDYILTPVTQ